MTIHVIQHVYFEGPGSIEEWAESRGRELATVRLYSGDRLPDPEQVDLLVLMGGPMGVYDEERYPWLVEEKVYLKRYLEAGKKVAGICLGAQLLADVLGAAVYRNDQKEIGWFPVRWKPEARQHPMFRNLPEEQTVLHWHGDTFDLPAGSIHLASSEACENQGFLFGTQALGLQFHLEMTPGGLEKLAVQCSDKLLEGGKYIQSVDEMLAEEAPFGEINHSIETVLDEFVSEG